MDNVRNDRNIRIVLADDHGVVRAGLRALLDSQADMVVVGEAADGPEAVNLARTELPTVVITDLSMPGGGMETIREIASLGNQTRVLVLTVHAEERYLLPVLEAGGSGYVRKSSAHTDLIDAVRTVAKGEVFLDGRPVAIRSPQEAQRLGISLVPEDRKRQGLVVALSVRENLSLGVLDRLRRWLGR